MLGTFNDMSAADGGAGGPFRTIGQAGGPSPQWPRWKSRVHVRTDVLRIPAAEARADRMEAFVKAVENQWIPYRLNAAGRSAFGVSMSGRMGRVGRMRGGTRWKGWTPGSRGSARSPNLNDSPMAPAMRTIRRCRRMDRR